MKLLEVLPRAHLIATITATAAYPTAAFVSKLNQQHQRRISTNSTRGSPDLSTSSMAQPCVTEVSDPESLKALVPQLCELSAGTEMGSYKADQWSFLVAGGGDVTAFTCSSSSTEQIDDSEEQQGQQSLLGCVLKIGLSDTDKGYGMMLVSPQARGQGLARTLLTKAMAKSDTTRNDGRNILAVCTELGQPFYRKLGFRNVGNVSFLSTKADDCSRMELTAEEEAFGNEHETTIYVTQSADTTIDASIQQTIVNLDRQATGYNRSGRLGFLMSGQAGEYVSVGIVRAKDGSSNGAGEAVGMAILRQDEAGGSYVLGPIVGTNSAVVLPLLQSLLQKANASEDATINMLISDHTHLVERLVNAGYTTSTFSKSMELPAMAQDDGNIYKQTDGMQYLGLIHPTLG